MRMFEIAKIAGSSVFPSRVRSRRSRAYCDHQSSDGRDRADVRATWLDRARRPASARSRNVQDLSPRPAGDARRSHASRRRHSRQREGRVRPRDDDGDGQAAAGRPRRSRQVRVGLPLLCGARRAAARRRAGGDRGLAQLHPLPAARSDSRGHALELPVLAGLPVCCARSHGRQRRAAQARFQRAAVRAADRRRHPARRVSRRRVPGASDRLRAGVAGARRSACGRRDAHRKRRCRPAGGQPRRRSIEEVGARARRQRSLHRHAQCQSGGSRRDRRQGAHREQRPVVHCRQALHRGRADCRCVRAGVHRSHGGSQGGRPARRDDGSRTARERAGPRPICTIRCAGRWRRGRGC